MPRFKFQLEGVLEHRKNIEEEKQRALAGVLAEMQRLKNELLELDQVARGADILRTHRGWLSTFSRREQA